MKKMLMILGVIFLVVIMVCIIGFSIVAIKGTALDKESKSYVDRTVPIILANLNKETLFGYASQNLIDSASPEDFDRLFGMFARIGHFKKYIDSSGQATMNYNQQGKTITAQYISQAEFETGPVTVDIGLIRSDNGWKIQMFKINSKVFIE